ncbi:ornithine cyclodeaminase family protein [Rothia halotolerans]|uniref:ornithine cyclodeaminase family protein n=1 Tax=Rothia halotolerans TaxID=405770 RepID=UPI00192D621A|nr:ornithine cyclodeaminase family protein [Rothia halotolerans]
MPSPHSPEIRSVGPDQVMAHLPLRAAVDALRQALQEGLDPARQAARTTSPLTNGEFLLMPSEFEGYAGVKILTVAPGNPARGLPKIQGSYMLFDAETLQPLALIDGIALTSIRTPAVSALAIDALAAPDAADLLVFGTGPQALHHVRAAAAVRHLGRVGVVGRSEEKARELAQRLLDEGFPAEAASAERVAEADVIACCTSAREPLFDGSRVRPEAVVVAMGSHEPGARETDDALAARASVYVEDRETALREAGDVVLAVEHGAIAADELLDVATMLNEPRRPGPALVKTVGMGWQDLVTARALFENLPG